MKLRFRQQYIRKTSVFFVYILKIEHNINRLLYFLVLVINVCLVCVPCYQRKFITTIQFVTEAMYYRYTYTVFLLKCLILLFAFVTVK